MLPSFLPHNDNGRRMPAVNSDNDSPGPGPGASSFNYETAVPLPPSSHGGRRSHYHQDDQTIQLAPPSFSICVTGVMSTEGSCIVSRTLNDGSTVQGTIRYRIFRPRQLHPPGGNSNNINNNKNIMNSSPPPLVVLHGGPGVPCNYLLPLVNVVTDRAIVYYDQLGCGKSSRLDEYAVEDVYSIPLAVQDLSILITKEWKLRQGYHLYGHSWGGILAFEYLKQQQQQHTNDDINDQCLSVILASTPTRIDLVERESERLLQDIMKQQGEADDDNDSDRRRAMELFRYRHECQTLPIPLSLIDSYAQAGRKFRGISAIANYVATLQEEKEEDDDDDDDNKQEENHHAHHSPLITVPAFVIRGQDDFVTDACIRGWNKMFVHCQTMVLAGCSHYGMLENEQLYGDVISSFLVDHDPSSSTNDNNNATKKKKEEMDERD